LTGKKECRSYYQPQQEVQVYFFHGSKRLKISEQRLQVRFEPVGGGGKHKVGIVHIKKNTY
jgi:hypothetical protein